MGIFKKLAQKYIDYRVDKILDDNYSLSPEEKAQLRRNTDLIAENFENNVISGGKATLAFIVAIPTGPAALVTAVSVAASESAKNQRLFIASAVEKGIPTYVDGKIINPEMLPPPPQQEDITFNAKAIGIASLTFMAIATAIAFLPGEKKST